MSTLTDKLSHARDPQPVDVLEQVEVRLEALPIRHPARVTTLGPGVARAQEQVPLLCRTLDDAVEALRTGQDQAGNAISAAQVGTGLQLLVDGATGPGVARLMRAALDDEGVREFEDLVADLGYIAAALRGGRLG